MQGFVNEAARWGNHCKAIRTLGVKYTTSLRLDLATN